MLFALFFSSSWRRLILQNQFWFAEVWKQTLRPTCEAFPNTWALALKTGLPTLRVYKTNFLSCFFPPLEFRPSSNCRFIQIRSILVRLTFDRLVALSLPRPNLMIRIQENRTHPVRQPYSTGGHIRYDLPKFTNKWILKFKKKIKKYDGLKNTNSVQKRSFILDFFRKKMTQ